MQVMDDMALLREYSVAESESAFATLVSRHIDFVYSAALRQVRDPHLAKDITQAVFIILARKAGSISPNAVLSGWLFKTVRFTASAQLKAAIRRRRREHEAQMNSLLPQTLPDPIWDRMAPLLDEALAKLNEKDRQAVLLRYFENKSLAQVGGALSVNEDAARKRIGRAVEKMRQFFARGGIGLSAIALGSALSTFAVQAAPAGLAATISATAVQGSTAAASTLTLVKGALKLMTLAKLKVAAAVGTATIAVTAMAFAVEELVLQSNSSPPLTESVAAQPDSSAPDVALANSKGSASAGNVVTRKEAAPRPARDESVIDDSAWSQMDSRVLSTLPAAFIVRPTHFSTQTWGMVSSIIPSGGEKVLGRAISFRRLIAVAYGVPSGRILFSGAVPEGNVDVLMTVPDGSKEMLQEEIRKQFGVVANREMREGEVLAVRVKSKETLGLRPSREEDPTIAVGSGGSSVSRSSAGVSRKKYSAQHQSIDGLIQNLQNHFEETLYDDTGLTGNYDITFEWDASGDKVATSNAIKAAMQEQLGLELVPGRAEVEMLVVRKAE